MIHLLAFGVLNSWPSTCSSVRFELPKTLQSDRHPYIETRSGISMWLLMSPAAICRFCPGFSLRWAGGPSLIFGLELDRHGHC